MSVLEFAKKGVVTVGPETSALAAAQLMGERSVGCLVVLEGRRPVGIVTERDLVRRVVAADLDPRRITVSEAMTAPIVTVPETVGLVGALELMRRKGVKHLPVTDDTGQLCGFFTFNNALYLLGFGFHAVTSVADHERGVPSPA